MAPRVSTGDQDALVRQVQWCAAIHTSVNSHCQLEKHPVGRGRRTSEVIIIIIIIITIIKYIDMAQNRVMQLMR